MINDNDNGCWLNLATQCLCLLCFPFSGNISSIPLLVTGQVEWWVIDRVVGGHWMYYMAILIFALFKSASKKQQVLDEECFTTCTYSYLKPSTMWTFILWIRGDVLSGSRKRRLSKKCFCQLKCCGGWLWMGSGHVGSGVGRGIRGTNHAHGLPHSWTIGTNGKCK